MPLMAVPPMLYCAVMSSLVSPKRRTVNVAVLGPQLVNKWQTTAGHAAQAGVAFVSPRHIQLLVPSTATGSVATMLRIGGRFVRGGGSGRIVISTGGDVIIIASGWDSK